MPLGVQSAAKLHSIQFPNVALRLPKRAVSRAQLASEGLAESIFFTNIVSMISVV